MRKLNILFIGIISGALAASVLLECRARAKFRDNEAVLREQENRLAGLAAENQRLSALIAQAKTNRAGAEDRTAELAQLRAKVEALRRQTNQLAPLAGQETEQRRLAAVQFFATGDSNLLQHNYSTGIVPGGGPRLTGKLNDAKALAAALRHYASDHQGEFPASLDLIAAYLPKPLDASSSPFADAPLTGTNDFEIVFQGSQSDLSNIPPRRVALVRERQPCFTLEGKWERVYGYADGAVEIIQSDDNYQSWDAQHVVPSQAASQ
jgi:multidrug efflux pump subunit AcrA (membrane-fusion protein)